MPVKFFTIFLFLNYAVFSSQGQLNSGIRVSAGKEKTEVLPGQVVNLPFFVENNSDFAYPLDVHLKMPENWKIISQLQNFKLDPGERKFLIITVQIPSNNPMGEFRVTLNAIHSQTGNILDSFTVHISVGEVEKINLILVESPDYISGGEEFRGTFLLQNLGNTAKKVFIETHNCQVTGEQEIVAEPGESVKIYVVNKTSPDITETRTVYYIVRVLVSGEVAESIFRNFLVFPSKESRKDLYFRFPVTVSNTYLASNQGGTYEHAFQFEFSGGGALDPDGKHRMEFLARGPNNSNLTFLGMYDQYYISYENDNFELFAGEKSFNFTPLTESARYGLGAESKVIFNNGLNLGFLYVKPRFFKEIENEMAAFTGFKFNERNNIELFAISKQSKNIPEPVHLFSLNSALQPFDRSSVELEISRGRVREIWDNAFRANISSQFSLFNIAGNYFYTGKEYPGYYSNSTFYSGNFSANLTPKLSLGFYVKEDFINAQLDTFFVTAPYSKSIQTMINYNIASRTYLKFFLREYERKDRLALDKFHYKTQSVNAHFNKRLKKIEYSLLGEYGETTNFLLDPQENKQNTYRGSVNAGYRFSSLHALRIFGSWSNINRFVSGEQRNLTAGLSVISQLAKNLRANFHVQNAYNIEDYYRNRNLMQFNLDFTPGRNHRFSLRSFYTLFRQQTDNPEFTFSANYSYNIGIPLGKVINAGDVAGIITRDNGEPADGILVSMLNYTTRTGKTGEFGFKAVPVGIHYLNINQTNIAIDEITSIPDPIGIEVLEDRTAFLHLKITKGARLLGKFETEQSEVSVLQSRNVNPGNIIIELRNEREQFRITTGSDGEFSFPLVRPGEWTFRIYTNSLPDGYEVESPVTNLTLEPGQNQSLSVRLKPRKRNIIFKPMENTGTLTPGNLLKSDSVVEKPQDSIPKKDIRQNVQGDVFYAVQIGAFKKRLTIESDYFAEEPFDFERKIDNLHCYFIGRFTTFSEAKKERERLLKIYSDAFIVKFENERNNRMQ